ncbi:hypothetical protein [Verrucomicrobium sp. BvORR106]|uniref:hypothetical protein n=1 Tax=Verrucomicrobium sp. BvORR106 TaxID=1403819 RepID=UPI00057092C6|nr:hypothetical protein [Verrucomicrobium sp. BvORR106]
MNSKRKQSNVYGWQCFPPVQIARLILALSISLLMPPSICFGEIPAGKAETFGDYIKNSKHVVLVCEVQKTAKPAERPGTYHEVHVSATVVRLVKGQGVVGDRLSYYTLCEDRIPPAALEVGGLTFLMLDDYQLDKFLLGTGDGWRYTPELDGLLSKILKAGK